MDLKTAKGESVNWIHLAQDKGKHGNELSDLIKRTLLKKRNDYIINNDSAQHS
jgi:hypothetical protein